MAVWGFVRSGCAPLGEVGRDCALEGRGPDDDGPRWGALPVGVVG